jgi:hypothetical protein
MPNRNGTGPAGMGPMSGRGMGRCGGGRGAGNGQGLGLGRRGGFRGQAAPQDETQALKARVAELEKRLNEKGEGK